MKKYNINKLNDKKIVDLKNTLHQFLSKVNPEYLSELSKLVDRDLVDEKDTEDYNFDLVSSLVDKTAQVFMEAGQKEITGGDIISVTEKISQLEGEENTQIEDLLEALTEGSYEKYPFSMDIVRELRAKFLLKTEQKDTFKDLMEQLEEGILKFITKEDWQKIKTAMDNSEKRIFEEDLDFINPPEGMNQGDLIPLTKEEANQYGLTTEIVVDKRKDNHDLLSLKELVGILQGELVDHLSIGPGFFLKYMPELRDQDVDAIVFKVVDNKVQEIKVQKVYQAEQANYSPISAGIALFKTYGATHGFQDRLIGEGTANAFYKKRFTFIDVFDPKDVVLDNTKYYVCVDGCVAAPDKTTPIGYEKPSYNTKRVFSGETFLFEKQKGEIMSTRLYFMPYKMSEVNPILQTGSVVWGSNDQSMHSCVRNPKSFSLAIADRYKQWWSENKDERYSEVATAAKVENYIEEVPEEIFAGGTHPLYPDQHARHKILGDACLSVLEVSEFTMSHFLVNLNKVQAQYGANRRDIGKYLENYAPLTKRFLVKKYVDTKNGLTLEYQPTFYRRLGKKFKSNQGAKMMLEMDKMERVEKLVEGGKTYQEAVEEVYPADEVKNKLKQKK